MEAFKKYLYELGYSQQTINTYCYAVSYFFRQFKDITTDNLLAWKKLLIKEKRSPQTINVRLQGLRHYSTFLGETKKVAFVRIPKRVFLNDVLTMEEYLHLLNCLKKNSKTSWYFLVKFLACTGARVSEVLKFTSEHVKQGYMDVYGKGTKQRRIWIPQSLRNEALTWDRVGKLWSWRIGSIGNALRRFGRLYGVNPQHLHPHAFRHFYARMFYKETKDIQLLSNLLGHTSINTTMIYLLQTNLEITQEINSTVTW